VNVDDGATLQLVGTIQGDGNIIVDQGPLGGGGTLQVEGIATLDGITVTDNGTVQIDLAQGPTSILTLEDGASIAGGQLNIGGVGELDVAAGPQGPVGGGNPDATLDGVTVANGGTISVEPAASGLILQLDDATTITGGNLVIGSGSALDVEVGPNGNGGSNGSNFDAMLDGVTVINGGTINVDLQDNGGAILTLADGTTISGGNLDINNGGGVYVQNGSNSSFGATLDNVTVTTSGNEIEIGAPITTGSILNLEDGTVISGGTLSLDDAADVVNVAFGTNATGATLDGVTVNNNGTVQVDPTGQGATLTLDDYTQFNNGNLSIGSQGTVALSSASINGTAIAFVGSGGTLSLDAASTISGPISGFGDGDTLDFTGITWSATVTDIWNDTTNTLTVSDGTHTATLNLVGQYDQNSFALKQDAGAGVDVVSSPAEAVFSATDGNGDVAEGLPLSVTLLDFNPTFDPNSVTYQWLSDGQAISGQTGKSYTPTATDLGKTLDVVVRFTDGRVEQVTADAPAVVAPPVVSDSADAGGVTTHQNTALTLTGLNVTFADAGTDTLEATLSVGHGTLSFVNAAGLTVISDGTSGSPLDVTGSLSDINAALANGVVYSPTTGYTGPDTLSVHANDGSFGSNTDSININVASNPFAINEAPQTPSVADDGTWYATGKFTVSDPVSGDSLTWTIVGGSRESSASYQYGIHQFAVTKVVNGTPTTVFNDTFNGTVPPAGPAILLGSSPSGTSYSDFSSGTYAQGNGEALLEGSNAGYVGSASGLGSTYGDPVFGQFTTLLTGTSFNAPAGDGLRSGQSFTTSGLFDLATPPNTNSRYGIRLSDRATNAGAADQPGTETVDFGVFQNGNGTASVVLSELNFESGISTVLQTAIINLAHADDNEILLSLSNNAANNGVVTASYTLEHVVGGVEVADGGPVTLGAVGRIFDNEDWVRPQFYGFSVATTTSASPQADSILQGTYGQLDLQQDGTWHYVLNPGLASVKALAAGQVAQDNFQVQVNGTGGQATQTISVNVTGINDPPVATTPTAHYHTTPGTVLSLVNTGLSVSDPDGGNSLETATLSVGEGNITITAGNSGISNIVGNGTGSVTFSGTIAEINALLNNSSGTIVYLDNSASPSSSTALTLTIDDNGSNGGSALSDSASATIDLSSASFGSSDWRHDINVFGATQGTATQWIVANRDGGTSTVFNGGGITYDPSTHLPTNGGISSISLVDNASQTVLQTITGVAISAGDFGSLVARLESIQDKIPWASLVNLDSNGPLSFSATDIHFANNDGTFTDVIGTGFAQSGDQLSGTVTSVELLDAQGHVLQTAGFGLSTSLSDVAAALFPDEASKQFYNLALRGNTSLTGFSPSGNSTNFNFTLDDAPGNHTITGPAQSFYTVDFADATSGVTVNLGTGTASWGGHLDTLVHIANVAGSKFADTITGDANINFLDGQGAQGGGHDTLTGGGGSDTFEFQQGYGALTITDFDQGNSGSFSQSENDLIVLNNFAGQPTVSFVNGNTVADFGNGDVLTLQNVTQSEFTALGGSEFIGGGNNGGNGNGGGPVIIGADNTVAFAGVPVALDPAIAVTDTTGTVSSVNVWISSGAQSGDTLTINGSTDGNISDGLGNTIHYHFDSASPDGPSIFLSAFTGTPTAGDFDGALQSIEFSPGAADGNRTVTWAAYDNVVHSPTVTTTVEVGPVLNGFGLTVTEGSTTVLSNSNFAVSDPGYSDLTYTVNNVIGGHFEVYNGTNWVSAPTGGFTTSQIAAEEVRFVQDGSATVPDLSIHVSDPNNASADIAAKMSLEITGVNSQENSQTITFGGPSGTLQLDNPSSFTGEIAGIAGSGDVLDLLHFLNATTTAVTGNGSYDSTSNTTTLTVTDSSNGGQTETFKLVGDYSHSTWTVSDDHHGGSNIVDPPAPVGQTIVATAQNQTLTGSASGDNFVFNSANIGHDTVTDFQPGTDLLQFANQVFATAQAALDATRDDGHGNTVVALDSHDNITLSGVVKAQLHLNDFHIA
jgi:VCBS repeat-containing protein